MTSRATPRGAPDEAASAGAPGLSEPGGATGAARPDRADGEGRDRPGASPQPPSPEARALADSLSPERLVILPFYHELRNAFVKPERVKLQTEYFWLRWVPLLGPVRSLIVMRMRQYGYFNRQTRELRDECARTYEEIAASIGISTRSLERYFESEPDPNGGPYRVLKDPLLARFIRLRHQYVWRPGKSAPERTTNEYKIAMDEPLTPEDEAAFRLAAAQRLAPGSGEAAARHTRQGDGYAPPARPERQSVGYSPGRRDRQVVGAEGPDAVAAQPVVPSSTPQPRLERPRLEPGLPESTRPEPAADEVVPTFEGANARPASPLERQLLAALSAEFEGAARARGASGAAWVAAAIVEAVESGSRFVAPKRVREICRRWAKEGAGPAPRGPEGRDEAGPTPAPVGDPARPRRAGPEAGASRGRRRAQPVNGNRTPAPPLPALPEPAAGLRAGEPGGGDLGGSVSQAVEAEAAAAEVDREPPAFVVAPSLGLTSKQLWAAVLDELRPTCPPGAFATWLKPARLVGLEGRALVVGAPNSFARQWLEERFAAPIGRAVTSILGEGRPLRFEVY